MKSNSCSTVTDVPTSFDFFRLTKAKSIVDLAPNTLRAYHDQGLPFYRRGRACFVSKSELESFIRLGPEKFKALLSLS
jgi:hypothetical protein